LITAVKIKTKKKFFNLRIRLLTFSRRNVLEIQTKVLCSLFLRIILYPLSLINIEKGLHLFSLFDLENRSSQFEELEVKLILAHF